MKYIPVVELSDCILCEMCTDICPSVFTMNESGYVEVEPLEIYPVEEVDEVIKNCPADCIQWEEEP